MIKTDKKSDQEFWEDLVQKFQKLTPFEREIFFEESRKRTQREHLEYLEKESHKHHQEAVYKRAVKRRYKHKLLHMPLEQKHQAVISHIHTIQHHLNAITLRLRELSELPLDFFNQKLHNFLMITREYRISTALANLQRSLN